MLRRALEPNRYGVANNTYLQPPGKADHLPFDHLDHYVNNIRESLMCSAAIRPNVV